MDTMTIILLVGVALAIFLFVARRFASRHIIQYEADQARQLVKAKQAVLLDVRSDAERKVFAVPGSLHIPLGEIGQRAPEELKKYADQEIICYCASGIRSVAAADQLGKLGYRSASVKRGMRNQG